MKYNVAEVTTPDGVFFTARTDNRTPKKVVYDCVKGYRHGRHSPIYASLNKHQTCLVKTIFTGLSKQEATEKRKTLIEYARAKGKPVLNRRSW